jgi:hypothetical protein
MTSTAAAAEGTNTAELSKTKITPGATLLAYLRRSQHECDHNRRWQKNTQTKSKPIQNTNHDKPLHRLRQAILVTQQPSACMLTIQLNIIGSAREKSTRRHMQAPVGME